MRIWMGEAPADGVVVMRGADFLVVLVPHGLDFAAARGQFLGIVDADERDLVRMAWGVPPIGIDPRSAELVGIERPTWCQHFAPPRLRLHEPTCDCVPSVLPLRIEATDAPLRD